jgi:hypothetical protein
MFSEISSAADCVGLAANAGSSAVVGRSETGSWVGLDSQAASRMERTTEVATVRRMEIS